MKRILGCLCGLLLILGAAGNASALTMTFFDFENGVNELASTLLDSGANPNTGPLSTYMTALFGQNVNTGDTSWIGTSDTFSSDAIFNTVGSASRLDFARSDAAPDFKITAVSFDWGVVRNTGVVDFGLNVYDKLTSAWINNVFTVNQGAGTGSTGVINFNDTWQITQLRFHDSDTFDVGMDNLTVWDNRVSVPEPATMLVLGIGLAGIAGFRRKFHS